MKIIINIFFLNVFLTFISLGVLKAEVDPFQYRGVKLGMTKQQIAELESVREGYMVNPLKMSCKNLIFYFDPDKDKIHATTDPPRKVVLKLINKNFEVCGNTFFRFIRVKPYGTKRIKGNKLLFNDDFGLSFYKGNLYSIDINYASFKPQVYNLVNSSYQINTKNYGSDYIENTIEEIKSVFLNSKKADLVINNNDQYNSKLFVFFKLSNDNIRAFMDASYGYKKIMGLNAKKKFTSIHFNISNSQIEKKIENFKKIFFKKKEVQNYKNLQNQKMLEKELKKKKKQKLDKKYNY